MLWLICPSDYLIQWLQYNLHAESLPKKSCITYNLKKKSNRPQDKIAGNILEKKSKLASSVALFSFYL